MEFTLTISCDNEAFTDDPKAEIARILRVTADALENGNDAGRLRDANGNTVGLYEVAD